MTMNQNTRRKQDHARFNMIQQQIRPAEVLDQRVLDTIAGLPREDFVPAEFRELAYADINVPLDPRNPQGEVMMKPVMEARLLQALDVKPGDEILEIGTGSGYFTGLLGRLGSYVTSVEIRPEFLAGAQAKLTAHGIENFALMQGDASRGWELGGPFDVIAITGSLPVLRDNFQRQLKIGGRLVVITGTAPVMEARLITRIAEDQWVSEVLFETDFPPLRNAEQPPGFVF